jgi:hypothetical protein
MFTNWARWSSVGFWILMVGMAGELLVIFFIKSATLERRLAGIFTIVITVGVVMHSRYRRTGRFSWSASRRHLK